MPNYRSFETERLLLIPSTEDDAAFVLELLNTPKWLQYIGDRKVHTLEAAKEYIRNRMLPQYAKLGYGNYTVTRKDDGAKLGNCGLYDREGLEGIDIGFAFLPEHEGKGYAREAATEVKRAAIEVFGLNRIGAITVKENTSSQKLLEKLGLRFLKTVQLPNSDEELLYYELIVTPAPVIV
ncbi:GNAT family N-acetyltransferase [Pontibacter sp. BT310]|uniref:GNAT family N-acetyltransferase n=1 Tax=Pontibacter populi TaxID=890055 RepID=A0ABS6XEK6_9BACT|nr:MULTISPECIES: GNAT family N-acetyltransferase [Pontibacter]MBJ6119541.1 GNAT family N-acetyltransferase [Pontibacter sp. BT310]MBR0571968.1 GNAT family N-acetyltransferase [Microvirga sp. STS03]MBW3366394.1 GNAT family N-acetyltransferase [Pontibacter populi]